MTDSQPESPGNDATPTKIEASANVNTADESVSSPEFQELKPGRTDSGKKTDLNRFHDVQVTVAAELGRINVSIHDLLDLTEGSVFELNRSISAPVELIAQGIPLGNGEVVVVDDTFAIRIKEIYANS